MGLSQAKWRTLLHLSVAAEALTQAEIAERLGVEEPSLVTLLHRLESAGWVTRRNSPDDRRCKTVHLGRRAQRVIAQINAAAFKLRHELLGNVSPTQLRTCMRVLAQIRQKAEEADGIGNGRTASPGLRLGKNGRNRNGHAISKVGGRPRPIRK
jgi:MarR family transcriptional regulator for hemolysin